MVNTCTQEKVCKEIRLRKERMCVVANLLLCAFTHLHICTFAQINPPLQPTSGPGGSQYLHQSVTWQKYGSGATAYWLFEPDNPKPDSANFIVFNHGWGALNPACYGKWLTHLVRKGNMIVFPKWQYDLNTFPQFFTPSAATAIKDAVTELANGNHVKPRYENTAYIGYSFGGVISSNLAILADSTGIPEPKALLVCNAGNGNTQGSLLPTYTTMPDIKLLIIAGNNDAVVGDTFARMLFDSTIMVNPLFKNHLTQYYDGHGYPSIEATHNEPISWDSVYWSSDFFDNNWVVNGAYTASKLDAVDFFCYWKFADAITDCAFYGTNCEYAFCKTPEEKFMGIWSDGTPVTELFAEAKAECNNQVTELHAFPDVVIFPNPNNGNFTVQITGGYRFTDGESDKYPIKIYNMLGEVVYSARKSLTGTDEQLFISTHLPNGIYFLMLHEGEKIRTTAPISVSGF